MSGVRVTRLSITLKLLALMALTTGAVVLFLAIYFPTQQINESHAALERKASTYGRLIARQVASAIAFDDRETAREVFDSVAQDSDVESLVLLTSEGATLHSHGVPGKWIEAAKHGVVKQRVLDLGDRIAVVAPVVSAEGPRGTLVVELSTSALERTKAAVTRTAAIVGLSAMLLSMLLAYAIARSLGKRLATIARTASAVAAGDLEQQAVVVRGHDEIATLASAFNAMLLQIQSLFAQIHKSAHEEKARLESLVSTRTAELDLRNDDMRLVLDNVDQGFLSVDLAGRMSPERSAIVDRWLGVPTVTETLFSYLDHRLPGKGDYMRVAWEALSEDWMPLEMRLSQLPKEFEHEELHLGLAYQPIFVGETLHKILVVVSDMTPVVEKRRAEEEERELVQVVRKLLSDHTGFKEYLAEAGELVASILAEGEELPVRLRQLHTLKGNSAIFGFDSLMRLCHELEGIIQSSGADLTLTDKHRLQAAWTRLREKIDTLIKGRSVDTVEVKRVDLARVVANVNAGASAADVSAMIQSLELEPAETRMARVAEYARALAERLGKGPIDVRLESNDVRLDGESWTGFWHALVHVVRNAVDHGLETPGERQLAHKPETGVLILRSQLDDGRLHIEVEDEGRGIDWARVASVARRHGIPSETHDQLVEALMADGLSTRDHTTETSGRGVGLSAVREACTRSGGRIAISSNPGKGTLFRFSWQVATSGRPIASISCIPCAPAAPSVNVPRLVNVS